MRITAVVTLETSNAIVDLDEDQLKSEICFACQSVLIDVAGISEVEGDCKLKISRSGKPRGGSSKTVAFPP